MSEELQNNTELTDEQVTDLYNKINEPTSNDVKMESESAPKTWELAEGVTATEEDLINYAKQGYEVKQGQESWLKEKEQYTPIVDKYKQIDEFAMQNPEWWEHVQNSYSTQGQTSANISQEQNEQSEQSNLSPELQTIQNQINEISQFMSTQRAEQEQKVRFEEDKSLDAEINDIKEQYSYMDFSTPDESGSTLEQKVLKHAQDIGASSYRVAFRDYAHDKLIAKAQELGKEAVGKDIQRNTKLGILGESSKAPNVKQGTVKGKSYEDLLKEAVEELGI